MGSRKKKNPVLSMDGNEGASILYTDSTRIMTEAYSRWVATPRDPARVSNLYIDLDYEPNFEPSGGIEPIHQKHYMKRERLVQEIRDMFKYPLAAYEKHQDLMKEEKRSENLEIKGKYRERLKALTDENVALKYELEQLKKKL